MQFSRKENMASLQFKHRCFGIEQEKRAHVFSLSISPLKDLTKIWHKKLTPPLNTSFWSPRERCAQETAEDLIGYEKFENRKIIKKL